MLRSASHVWPNSVTLLAVPGVAPPGPSPKSAFAEGARTPIDNVTSATLIQRFEGFPRVIDLPSHQR
jgi:hypothetical protein